jgi:hypothetical protein
VDIDSRSIFCEPVISFAGSMEYVGRKGVFGHIFLGLEGVSASALAFSLDGVALLWRRWRRRFRTWF